jgi:hypothetical protein
MLKKYKELKNQNLFYIMLGKEIRFNNSATSAA